MVKYPTSNKTSSFGVKPHIRKGYYPGKLVDVVEFKDSDGNVKVGKYGKQLIFSFAVFKSDDDGKPIEPMKFQAKPEDTIMTNVVIPKFVYHMYKKTDKDKKWVEGEFQTAFTPNSAVTKLMQALGWEFSEEDVDPEEFIGNWVELDIDDYVQGEGDEKYTASTIKDINPYKGPQVGEVEEVAPPSSPKKVTKQVKHEAVKEPQKEEGESEEVRKVRAKMEDIKRLHADGYITENGFKQAMEQLETKLEELNK